jgi:SAM-dependent methyltransferase
MLSDGRLVPSPLEKLSCLECGATCHAHVLSFGDVQDFYQAGAYSLSIVAPASDAARACAYSNWLFEHVVPKSAVLEIGCGSGALLRELSRRWPAVSCVGIDPALSAPVQSEGNLRLEPGSVADLPADVPKFDLVVGVNVIEHMLAPDLFFSAVRAHISVGGQIALVYPAPHPPNVELLFQDHIHTLTAEALSGAAAPAGFSLLCTTRAPSDIGDFELSVFGVNDGLPSRTPAVIVGGELAAARESYMRSWAELDEVLLARLSGTTKTVAFGAGQTTALLRAYTPKSWELLEGLIVDQESEAWDLGKPILSYGRARTFCKGAATLVATSPRVQPALSFRLQQDGFIPVRFDDIIAR